MADQKSIGIAILGIAAVLAIIGLVLMFSTAMKSGAYSVSLPKIYGGAIKDVDYPMLQDRHAAGVGGDEYYAQDNPQYMYYERGVRQIPTLQTTCPENFARASYTKMLGYKQRGAKCFEHSASAYCCQVVGANGVI
ncbi:hypothetical protein GF358_03870 [Candidatus Woesearchaeota archaeon]|nr:hypothetical protein [Candidatus Woesearchaeota archaeon]